MSDLVTRLREISNAIADGNREELTMRIPAEPDRDADLVISRAADEIERLQAARAAPAQEPVAWMWEDCDRDGNEMVCVTVKRSHVPPYVTDKGMIPLYTRPVVVHEPGQGEPQAEKALTGEPQGERVLMPKVGDYVLATKWSDGDPGDAWAVGFYDGERDGRHFVKDGDGVQIRHTGYRRVGLIRKDVGAWLLKAAPLLEQSPPGTVCMWMMLTPLAIAGEAA